MKFLMPGIGDCLPFWLEGSLEEFANMITTNFEHEEKMSVWEKPNADKTGGQMLRDVIESIKSTGRCYLWTIRNSYGMVVEIRQIPSAMIRRSGSKYLVKQEGAAGLVSIPAEEVGVLMGDLS